MFMIFLQAGLKSAIIHSKFRKEAGGPLQLVRRCEAYTCEGHCTCAAQDKRCPISSPVACVNDTASRNIVFEFNCIYIPHKWNRHDLICFIFPQVIHTVDWWWPTTSVSPPVTWTTLRQTLFYRRPGESHRFKTTNLSGKKQKTISWGKMSLIDK